MISSETKLAELLDDWSAAERALITERRDSLVVGQLSDLDATNLTAELDKIGWDYEVEDGGGNHVPKLQIDPDFAPYRIVASKPDVPDDRDFVVTNAGLADWLSRSPDYSILESSRLDSPFETLSVRFAPRGDKESFTSEVLTSDPRKVVRNNGTSKIVPADLSHSLLRPGVEIDVNHPTVSVWADVAARSLIASLCNEVEGANTVVFKGPPNSRYDLTSRLATALSNDGFKILQECARWVFLNPKEMETRHIFLTAELSRSSPGSIEVADLIKKSGPASLEGAKIAFELGLNKISADTLKALADLRKAVSDEASKLGDSTRQLANAVSGALFGGVGLIVARLTLATSNLAVSVAVLLIGFVLSLYVTATILSGYQFVAIQRDLREQWRDRLYRFLPEPEYKKMVTDPALRAERAFKFASWISGLLALGLMVAVVCITGPEVLQAWRGATSTASQAPDSGKTVPSRALPAEAPKKASNALPADAKPSPEPSLQENGRSPSKQQKRSGLTVWE